MNMREIMRLVEAAATHKFLHSSNHALLDGTVLMPQTANRASHTTEQILERNRPAHMISRQHAVFMVDDVLMLSGVGAALAYVYEVQPLGAVERHDTNWLIMMHDPAQADAVAAEYWRGEPAGSDPMWEYLTPRARIIRFAYDYDEDSGQFEPQ